MSLDSIIRDGLRLAAPGLAIGILGALALGQLIRSFILGVAPTDVLVHHRPRGASVDHPGGLLVSRAPRVRLGSGSRPEVGMTPAA
jgi:hypothetical protein